MPKGFAAFAKITRPKSFDAIPRERLYTLLDDRLLHGTVWVAGPPGAGKTTLLTGYLEERKKDALWYQLDSGDADVASFFYYLGVAADALDGSSSAEPLPALTPEYLPDLPGFTRRFFRALYTRKRRPWLLVLDNYQDVGAQAPLHGVIACAIAELPEHVSCVVISRIEPPAEFARLIATQALASIGWEALRVTEEETRHIAASRDVTDASIVNATFNRSGGWMTGLILLLGQPQGATTAGKSIPSKSPELLFNYFAAVFFNTLSEATRAVLITTALLQRITGPMAARISGNPRAGYLLQELHEQNYFVDRRVESEPTYQVHALFREFLFDRIQRYFDREQNQELRRKAADALLFAGEVEQAATLYNEVGDWRKATEIILDFAPRFIIQGRWQTVQLQILALPNECVVATPWLQYWLGASQASSDIANAVSTLAQAFESFAREHDTMGQMLSASAIIEMYCVVYADMMPLDRWIAALKDLLATQPTFHSPDIELQVLTNLTVALDFRVPADPALPHYAERALQLAQGDGDPSLRLMACAALVFHYAWLGHLERAQQAAVLVRPLLERPELLPVRKAWVCTTLAFYAYVRSDSAESEAMMRRAFKITGENGLTHCEFWMHLGESWQPLADGEYKRVRGTLGRLESQLVPARRLDVAHFHYVKSWLALLEADLPLARIYIEKAQTMAVASGATYGELFHLIVLVEVLTEQGDYSHAERYLAEFRTRFSDVGRPMFEFQTLLLESFLALKQHDEARCKSSLLSGLAIGAREGYVNTLSWYPRLMSRLCRFALQHDIEVEYVRRLIRRRGLLPDTPLEAWPWPVKIYTLGDFSITIDGVSMQSSGKAQHKPLALLKVLVALGGRDIAVDKLIDIVWPDQLEDAGQKSFDITLHRLRKLLSSFDALQVVDRRVTINPQIVWVDVWPLETTLVALIPAVNEAGPDVRLLEAAAPAILKLYRGHFLAGDTETSWQIPTRNRLAGRFQRFVLRLGEHWESGREWSRAAELYQRAIDLDPVAEAFYRRQMVCLREQGKGTEAIEVFRRCRQALSVILGMMPSHETEAVRRGLVER